MNFFKGFFLFFLFVSTMPAVAQSDGIIPINAKPENKIIDGYLKNIGGKETWKNKQSYKVTGSADIGIMKIPLEYYQTNDGKQLLKIKFYATEIIQLAFDGNTIWNTNSENMKAERSNSEASENLKKQLEDFPIPFLDYKSKGYTVKLVGEETKNGVETQKLEVTNPSESNGANTSYHYFDVNSAMLIISENGTIVNAINERINAVIMGKNKGLSALSLSLLSNTATKPEITIKEIVLNPPINDAMFSFPN